MAARSKARKRALDVLYEADVRNTDPLSTLAGRVALADPPINDYTVELVEGVQTYRAGIDEILSVYADGWTLARMPDVDRAVLRLGVYELLVRDDVPDAVAIDEAVELAKTLSTDESPRFVNGVLARVHAERPPLPAPAGGREAVGETTGADTPTADTPTADTPTADTPALGTETPAP